MPCRHPARLLALVVAGLLATSCSESRPADPAPDVLLVTLDATRADALSSYGGRWADTPHLDALASESVRFAHAITTAPYTGPSHASILTGLHPPRHGLRDFLAQRMSDRVATLPELLGAHGYRTAAFVSTYVLDRRFGLDRGFELYSGDFWRRAVPDGRPRPIQGSASFERSARETVDETIAWLEAARPSDRIFAWVHLFDAHAPYDPPPGFLRAWPDEDTMTATERMRRRYYDQVRFMDAETGRLFEALRRLGRYDRTVVVVVADHGELLGEHPGRPIGTHSTHLVRETLHVPLLVRAPGIHPPGVVEATVSVVDVLPTLLDALGLPPARDLAGRSLSPLVRGVEEPPRAAYSETFYERFPGVARPGFELVSVIEDGWQLLTRPGRRELFSLRDDPDSLEDRREREPERLERLEAVLAELRAGFAGPGESTSLGLTDEEQRAHIERLRSLGYVE